jgi:hypothetical protein
MGVEVVAAQRPRADAGAGAAGAGAEPEREQGAVTEEKAPRALLCAGGAQVIRDEAREDPGGSSRASRGWFLSRNNPHLGVGDEPSRAAYGGEMRAPQEEADREAATVARGADALARALSRRRRGHAQRHG